MISRTIIANAILGPSIAKNIAPGGLPVQLIFPCLPGARYDFLFFLVDS